MLECFVNKVTASNFSKKDLAKDVFQRDSQDRNLKEHVKKMSLLLEFTRTNVKSNTSFT